SEYGVFCLGGDALARRLAPVADCPRGTRCRRGPPNRKRVSATGGSMKRLVLSLSLVLAASLALPAAAQSAKATAAIHTLSVSCGGSNTVPTTCANRGSTGTGCTLLPEQVTLILDTTAAHSFSFILPNVGVGGHTLKIQARSSTGTTGTDPGNISIANAVYGLGSLTVEAVRLVN